MQSIVEWSLLAASFVIALLGGWLLVRGLLGRRDVSARACPACGYDMQATQGFRCPECGNSATNEAALGRRRRSWRRAAAGMAIIGVGFVGWAMHRTAREHGWKEVVPDTAWIVGVWATDAEMPMDELDLVGMHLSDPTDELWSWQRALLRSALRQRCNDETPKSPDTRAAALRTIGWLLPSRHNISDADIAMLRRLMNDPSKDIRMWAALFLAERLEAPQDDAAIRAIIEDPTKEEIVRESAFVGVLARHGAVASRSPENRGPSPQLVGILLERIDDRGRIGRMSITFANTIAERGHVDGRLALPLLRRAEAAVDAAEFIAGTAFVAAWRHAAPADRPAVLDGLLRALKRFPRGDYVHLLNLAKDGDLPEEAQVAVFTAALESTDCFDRDLALEKCAELSDDFLTKLRAPVLAALARSGRENGGYVEKPALDELAKRLAGRP